MYSDTATSPTAYGQRPGTANFPANDPFSVGAAYDPPFGDSPAPPPRDLEGPIWNSYEAPQKQRQQARVTDITISVILPWVVYFLITSLFLFVFHEMQLAAWIVVGLCISLAFLFLIIGACARHAAFVAIGFLCFTSVVVGTAVGLWLHSEYLDRYFELADGVEYWNVKPNADPTKTKDAAIVHFTPGTFVDDRRTTGFVSEGGILCLAPIVAPVHQATQVQYWAVGEDCCERRSNFDCGTAREPGALTAVIERATGRRYRRALAEAESVYGISSAPGALVVSFVGDPKVALGDIWDEALTIALISMIMDLCMCVVAGLVVTQILSLQQTGKHDRGV